MCRESSRVAPCHSLPLLPVPPVSHTMSQHTQHRTLLLGCSASYCQPRGPLQVSSQVSYGYILQGREEQEILVMQVSQRGVQCGAAASSALCYPHLAALNSALLLPLQHQCISLDRSCSSKFPCLFSVCMQHRFTIWGEGLMLQQILFSSTLLHARFRELKIIWCASVGMHALKEKQGTYLTDALYCGPTSSL